MRKGQRIRLDGNQDRQRLVAIPELPEYTCSRGSNARVSRDILGQIKYSHRLLTETGQSVEASSCPEPEVRISGRVARQPEQHVACILGQPQRAQFESYRK